LRQCLLHFTFGANDADQVLHRFLQVVLNLIWILAGSAAIEGLSAALAWPGAAPRQPRAAGLIALGEFRGIPAGAPSEYHQVRERIAAQPVGAVQSRRRFSRGKQPRHAGHLRIAIHADAAHHVMRGGARLPWPLW
jgi:hypothetical protein